MLSVIMLNHIEDRWAKKKDQRVEELGGQRVPDKYECTLT